MKYFIFPIILLFLFACKSENNEKTDEVKGTSEQIQTVYTITPISHATAVIEFGDKTIYMDPVGGIEEFKDFDKADAVFITHTHGDHLSLETLMNIKSNETIFVVPQTVADELPADLENKIIVMKNGEATSVIEVPVEAIAMYNIREEAKNFHPKGAGNGYVFQFDEERVYFSGDTEDTPEMKSLQNIDKAFVCMNMPYTMPVETAAEAVLAFQPKEVYPYHYRGQGGLSDTGKFKDLVNAGSESIEVIQWDWYPDSE